MGPYILLFSLKICLFKTTDQRVRVFIYSLLNLSHLVLHSVDSNWRKLSNMSSILLEDKWNNVWFVFISKTNQQYNPVPEKIFWWMSLNTQHPNMQLPNYEPNKTFSNIIQTHPSLMDPNFNFVSLPST